MKQEYNLIDPRQPGRRMNIILDGDKVVSIKDVGDVCPTGIHLDNEGVGIPLTNKDTSLENDFGESRKE